MVSKSSDRVSLVLFGAPRIERQGKPVEVDTRKALALVAYLALTTESHSREALAARLYPESDQAKARAALRRTLSTLKQALGDELLDADRETVTLNPNRLWVDIEQFHTYLAEYRKQIHSADDSCAISLSTLEKAVALYRDQFMAGFTLRDSPDFDDWQFFQTESLRRELIAALGILVCCFSQQHEYEKAIDYTRRWLALDPLDEPAHRQLMRLYAWTGQRAAALRQYRECVRLFDQELGVAPLEETTRLYEAIEENRVQAPSKADNRRQEAGGRRQKDIGGVQIATQEKVLPVTGRALASGAYPLVGRREELDLLLKRYEALRANGHWLVLDGEAGIGKTRLAEEFLARVRARGTVTITARCYEGEANLAYGPFIEGLRGLNLKADSLKKIPGSSLSEAARLLPELAPSRPNLPAPPPLDSPGAQARFFESLSQVLLTICGSGPAGLLFIDDLQWLDGASLELLTYLVRRLRGRPLCILGTWRSEQVGANHRLRALLAEAQRAGTATLIHLSGLGRDAVQELVQAAHSSSPELAERLYRETEGQPFFLIEYLALLEAGEKPANGQWSLPGGVRDLLRSRLNRVSETARQVLSAAAVIGRSFDFETLREVSGRTEIETVGALEELIGQGWIAEVRGAPAPSALVHDFQNETLRAFVYEELSLARRRLLHRRVAEALANRARGRREANAFASPIAAHYQAAGQDREAAEYHRLAGDQARSLYANAEALEHYRTALALGYPAVAELYEAIGDLQTLSGEYRAALHSYQAADAQRDGQSGGELKAKMARVYLRRGDWDLAENLFQAALHLVGASAAPAAHARIYADWSLAAHRLGRAAQAHQLACQALELAQAAQDQHTLAQAHNMLGILARNRDDLDTALKQLEQSLAMAEASQDAGARLAALNNLALVCRDRGDLARGIEYAETALALSKAQGDRHREAALHNNLADLRHAAGQSDQAMAHLRDAVTIYAEIGIEAGTWQPEIWKLTEW